MIVTINKQDKKTLVTLDGRIDSTNADQFQQDIAPLMEGDNPTSTSIARTGPIPHHRGSACFFCCRKASWHAMAKW